ncbi:MAG: hypothetical protein GY850_48220 [bacterium]|nr:hypothetical protein [bacterium]
MVIISRHFRVDWNFRIKNKNFIGVKTTKIYCLPSCPARAP